MSESVAHKRKKNFIPCRPFLKWAGGKTQLLDQLLARVPQEINRYFEPFFGGGALYFALQPEKAALADVNPELINVYYRVQNQVEELITTLSVCTHDEKEFYRLRALDREANFFDIDPVTRAARFIYLNKTCYNGLYRVNAKGQFNVPFGRYANPTICDPKNLRACGQVLKKALLTCQDFETLVLSARSGDFVYFDPPYAPISESASFTRYAKKDFNLIDQERLAATCRQLNSRGVHFMLSNSNAPVILDLYREFAIDFVSAARSINSKGTKRGQVQEVLVTNY